MGKLRVLSGAQVRRILEQEGFVEVRRRGSHVFMEKRSGADVIGVPVPDHREIKIGTLGSIIRQSGLGRALFEE